MNRPTKTLLQRVIAAPDTDARLAELVRDAPDRMLARLGLAHRSSVVAPVLGLAAAAVIGAAIGAALALALAPTTGKELQARLKSRMRRGSDTKKAAVPAPAPAEVEVKVTDGHRASPPFPPRGEQPSGA